MAVVQHSSIDQLWCIRASTSFVEGEYHSVSVDLRHAHWARSCIVLWIKVGLASHADSFVLLCNIIWIFCGALHSVLSGANFGVYR